MATNRLLLVEDDFDVAEMLLMYFQSINYEVLHADTGKEGINIARTAFPNLILLDVMLPDMDGYDICYQLRNMSMTKYIPTIFLTQRDERASKVKGLGLGADDYITKPFDIEELRLRIEGAIRRATRDSLHETRTGLPTGPLIQEERERRADQNELKFQLHGFSVYGDMYGFMAADDVLYHAGQTIRDVLSEMGRHDDFVGIQENHFVVFTALDDTQELETRIADHFNEQVRTFYSFADADRGGIIIESEDEDKEDRFYPMMSLTAGHPRPLHEEPKDSSSGLFDW